MSIKTLLDLVKFRITFFVAVSTSAGYILAAGNVSLHMILPTIGVLLVACGSSALNHYQEREFDAKMNRTRMRPIPSGAIKPSTALIIIFTLAISGTLILYFASGLTTAALGILALLWYNALYTPLKRVTAMAVVPGALIGSIPPAIGYTAAGGNLLNPEILAFSLFFFIWQIPHFWLLLLIHGRDYERAGYPVLTQIFSFEQLSRITFIWIVALAASCFLIPLFGIIHNIYLNIILFAAGVWLVFKSRNLLFKYYERITYRFAFREINMYVLIVVVLISLTKIFNF